MLEEAESNERYMKVRASTLAVGRKTAIKRAVDVPFLPERVRISAPIVLTGDESVPDKADPDVWIADMCCRSK